MRAGEPTTVLSRWEDPDACVAGQKGRPRTCTWHPEHYWCETCAGWYGCPHDGIHDGPNPHPYTALHDPTQCACRPCADWTAARRG